MLIAQQIINILGKFQPHVRMGGLYSILTELLCPMIKTYLGKLRDDPSQPADVDWVRTLLELATYIKC
jgi:hypothetical protein